MGAMGNLGGIVFALVFRFQPHPVGKAFWIAGIIALVCWTQFSNDYRSLLQLNQGINLLIVSIRVPKV